jgi:hypothetical protein
MLSVSIGTSLNIGWIDGEIRWIVLSSSDSLTISVGTSSR